MTDLVVFSGPTKLDGRRERARCRPPARKGDLRQAFLEGYRNFLLVDVCFLQAPTPTHAEILWLLEKGAAVHGSGSAGALRAVELEAYGMAGSGAVFSAYRAGVITDDAEVGVAMCPITYQCLSVPLVNVRATLRCLRDRGLDDHVVRAMFAAAAKIHFMDRTHEMLMKTWGGVLRPSCRAFVDSWHATYRDIKSIDATRAFSVLSGSKTLEQNTTEQNLHDKEIWHE
jgi:hypothetical protein